MNLHSIPKFLLVVLLLFSGVLLVILYDPPQSVCDLQMEVYKENNQAFLFPSKKSEKSMSHFQSSIKDCQKNNTPGGCYTLFSYVYRLIRSFRSVDSECHTKLTQLKEVQEAMFETYKLFIAISWGEGPTDDLSNPLAWLSLNDVKTFCQVQNKINHYYGVETLSLLENQVLQGLESAQNMNILKKFSVLSENCLRY